MGTLFALTLAQHVADINRLTAARDAERARADVLARKVAAVEALCDEAERKHGLTTVTIGSVRAALADQPGQP